MRATLGTNRYIFDSPAVYRIRAQGQIPANWSDRLEGMNLRLDAPAGGLPITTMEGELCDQSALAGVLQTLYEMHLPVLSVECLSANAWLGDRAADHPAGAEGRSLPAT